nr:hypothetical protein [Cryobacterium sp.]
MGPSTAACSGGEHEGSAPLESSSALVNGAVADKIEYRVIGRVARGEILRRVIDDVMGAEGTHEVDVAGAADRGDLGSEHSRELHRERPDATGCPVDEHGVSWPHSCGIPQTLKRRGAGDGHRRGGLEGDRGGLAGDQALRRDGVLRETPRAHLREHLVADRETVHGRSHRFDHARGIPTADQNPRLAQAEGEAQQIGLAAHQ